MVHDEPAAALGLTGSAGEWALRGEAGVRSTPDGSVLRLALGVDRWYELAGRDLRILAEYQRDGFGATSSDQLLTAASSPAGRRGELQTLGQDALALNANWQVHPLTELGALVLLNLRDGSALLAPSLTHSLGGDTSLRVGLFTGTGSGATTAAGAPGPILRSEWGATPVAAYAALNWYF